MYRAVSSWRAFVSSIKRELFLMTKFCARFKHARLISACTSWRAFVASMVHERHLMTGVVRRLKHAKLSSAMTTWRLCTRSFRLAKEHENQSSMQVNI